MRADSYLGRLVAALARSTPAFQPAHEPREVTCAPGRLDARTEVLTSSNWSVAAAAELARARRSGLLLLDMDQLRSVNDRWGHRAGDDVLAEVGKTLRTESEPNDVVGRFGGDEFVILLPDADLEQSMLVAERLRARIAELAVAVVGLHDESVVVADRTVSIGVAGKPRHGTSVVALVLAAENALHMAKSSGGNVVRAAGSGEDADAEEA